MEIVFRARQSGKTTELIRRSAETGSYVTAKYVTQMAANLGVVIPFPLTFEEFVSKQYLARGIRSVCVDDVDELIRYISGVPIEAVALSSHE